jgi:flagellar biosynthesis/type III secretory pathway protein FliH
MTDRADEYDQGHGLAEEAAAELERLRNEIDAAFQRGFAEGRQAQASDDAYYVERAEHLARLLAQAEAEIQRLRAKP